jgi:hypothetical protein
MDEEHKIGRLWKSRSVGASWTLKENPKPRRPWQAWLCAAPMPVVGMMIGLYLANASIARHVATVRAESPEAFICGLPFIPVLFAGLIGGSLGGIVAGGILGESVTWFTRKRDGGERS